MDTNRHYGNTSGCWGVVGSRDHVTYHIRSEEKSILESLLHQTNGSN